MALEDEIRKEISVALVRANALPGKQMRDKILWDTMKWCAAQLGVQLEPEKLRDTQGDAHAG